MFVLGTGLKLIFIIWHTSFISGGMAIKRVYQGFDEAAQEKFKKIFDYEIDANVELLSYEEILSLKRSNSQGY